MAAGNFTFYNNFKEILAKAQIDLDADTFKALLTTSSYTPAATQSTLSDVTNECSGGNYARQTLTNVTVTRSGGTVTFDCDDFNFGSNITLADFKYLVIFDDTHASDALVGYVDLNSGGGALSRSGQALIVSPAASGVFTLA